MDGRVPGESRSLLGFVVYALAAHNEPPLTQAVLSQALVAAFASPAGRRLADAAGLPSPELFRSQAEVIGAFGDWLRAGSFVDGCGFSRSGDGLTCAFRACTCLEVADRLRAEQPDVAPPCVLVGLLAALLHVRGISARAVSFRRTDEGCEWQLDLGR